MMRDVYISGMYSGPSPSAGVGVARALKEAYPDVTLTGVDFWNGSSGLNLPELSHTWILPPWDNINGELYAEQINAVLAQGAYWIPCLDLEVEWLAKHVGAHPRLLAPNTAALQAIAKPGTRVAEYLPFGIPEFLSSAATDEELYAFMRKHSWQIWLKGPYHDAYPVNNWRSFEAARRRMRSNWGTDEMFIQRHVRGHEESLCLCAVDGELIDAVWMQKMQTTPDGKTWAGKVFGVPEEWLKGLKALVRQLQWTGGAELELMKDLDGRYWVNEWNPRFPAWIYGTALAGRNLPAQLLGHVSQQTASAVTQPLVDEFIRIVYEVPVKRDVSFTPVVDPQSRQLVAGGKYGATLRTIATRMQQENETPSSKPRPPRAVAAALHDELLALPLADAETPQRFVLMRSTTERFAQTMQSLQAVSDKDCRLVAGFSIKTAPEEPYLHLAKSHGYFAECISQYEVRRARELGYAYDETILNGPGKWWPRLAADAKGFKAVFCDSREELADLVTKPELYHTLGVRLKLPTVPSRFGIGIGTSSEFAALTALIRQLPAGKGFGVHYHMASSAIGVSRWWDAFESVLYWASALEKVGGHPVQILDLGGGWHPDDFPALPFAKIKEAAKQALPALREIVFEPGKALAQPSMVLATRVLDVREVQAGQREIVMDACIAEMPLAGIYPHRLWWQGSDGSFRELDAGRDHVLGRICMEDDVLASGVSLPETIAKNDLLLIGDAGGYNRSMSYEFGFGGYQRP